MFACQDNLNNLWLLLYRFQKFAVSVKTICLHDNDIIITISFSNLFTLKTVSKVIVFSESDHRFWSSSCRSKVKTQRKACGFNENDMKTYSCRRGLKICWCFDVYLIVRDNKQHFPAVLKMKTLEIYMLTNIPRRNQKKELMQTLF